MYCQGASIYDDILVSYMESVSTVLTHAIQGLLLRNSTDPNDMYFRIDQSGR